MSLRTRLSRLERTIWPPEAAAGAGVTLFYAVHIHLGRHWGLPHENYAFHSWTGDGEPPADIHAYGSHMGADHLAGLAARGYTVALLYDPAHVFPENFADIAWPEYAPAHVIDWRRYVPGDCLRRAQAAGGVL